MATNAKGAVRVAGAGAEEQRNAERTLEEHLAATQQSHAMLQRSLQAQRANLQLELAESDAAALTMREAAQRDRQAALDLAEHRAEALEEHRIEELRAAKR